MPLRCFMPEFDMQAAHRDHTATTAGVRQPNSCFSTAHTLASASPHSAAVLLQAEEALAGGWRNRMAREVLEPVGMSFVGGWNVTLALWEYHRCLEQSTDPNSPAFTELDMPELSLHVGVCKPCHVKSCLRCPPYSMHVQALNRLRSWDHTSRCCLEAMCMGGM